MVAWFGEVQFSDRIFDWRYNLQINDSVDIHYSMGGGQGCIVKVVEPGKGLTDSELKKYCNLKIGDRDYRSVQGFNCTAKRFVIEKELDNYIIVPIGINGCLIQKVEGEENEV